MGRLFTRLLHTSRLSAMNASKEDDDDDYEDVDDNYEEVDVDNVVDDNKDDYKR